ncbi:MAG: phosphoglycerate dehydrogenase [Oscillospiraceae bacterium]|nr:phosphoglycerate dehydrogenase [Oscillospiraceae bacterium]
MAKIKTINNISEVGTDILKERGYTVSAEIENPDGIIIRSANILDFEPNDNLLAIARAGAGYNNIPVERCTKEGVVVFNSPGANAEAVKELEMCELILASRDVLGSIEWVKSISDMGDEIPALVEKGKSSFAGPELMGKTLGVIGLGATGALVANMGLALGMKVYGYDPYLSVDAAWRLDQDIIHADELSELLPYCDYISINVPYTDDTKGMFNRKVFKKMKDGVRITNESRAEVVNDDDMLKAIKEGKVARYVTDFPTAKLINQPNVICLPHLGACTPESEEKCALMAAEELYDYIENGNIRNSVNFPTARLDRLGNCRLCVIHRNVPNMLTSFLQKVGETNINVEHMINKSRGEYAYTIIDLSDTIPDNVTTRIQAMEEVLRVRVLTH